MTPNSKPRKPPPRREDEPRRDGDKVEHDHDVDEQLDKELEDTFPASDPPSLTQDPR